MIKEIKDRDAWNNAVKNADFPYFTYLYEWLTCFRDIYKLKFLALGYEDCGKLRSVFPLMVDEKNGEFFSPTPFGGVGGSTKIEDNIKFLDYIERLAKEMKIKRITIHLPPSDKLRKDFSLRKYKIVECYYFVQSVAGLDFDKALMKWKYEKRRNFRRSIKRSVRIVNQSANKDNIKMFYLFYEHVMKRNKAKTIFPIELFERFAENMNNITDVSFALIDEKPVASSIVFKYAGRLMTWFVVTHKDYLSTYANERLFGSAVENAIKSGCSVVDFGPSAPSDGAFNFKKKLGTEMKTHMVAEKYYGVDLKGTVKRFRDKMF